MALLVRSLADRSLAAVVTYENEALLVLWTASGTYFMCGSYLFLYTMLCIVKLTVSGIGYKTVHG